MFLPKILISCPTAEAKDYCFDAWAENTSALTYKNKQILIVDNSKNEKYQDKIRSKGFECIHYPSKPNETNREYVTACQNIIRQYALDNEFDYLFSKESDIFTPENIIEYLLSLKKQVVGIGYFIDKHVYSKYLVQRLEKIGGISTPKQYSLMNFNESFSFFDGTCKPALNFGLGCLLIHKSILKLIEFRFDLNDKHKSHADTFFHEDLRQLEIKAFLDTSVIAHHQNSGWFELSKKEKI